MWRRQETSVGTYVVGEELEDESGHAAIYANEEIHAGQHHVGCAGDLEHKGSWVHEWRYRPPGEQKDTVTHVIRSTQSTGASRIPSRDAALPIEQEEKGQRRQVGRGHVGLLLEADEDDDNQGGWNYVVALEGGRNSSRLLAK